LTADIVARRYAKALFAIGQGRGEAELEAYGKDLAAFAEVLTGDAELLKLFRNPIFSVEEKKAITGRLLDQLNPCQTIKNFCFLLADKKRLAWLPEIEAYYSVLLDQAKGVVPQARQEAVKKQLAAQLGKELVLDFSADAGILGGVVLKVGDKVLDASLRAQLNAMKEQIKRGE
jgi:F-type H+-transporting ATPase subunit delta